VSVAGGEQTAAPLTAWEAAVLGRGLRSPRRASSSPRREDEPFDSAAALDELQRWGDRQPPPRPTRSVPAEYGAAYSTSYSAAAAPRLSQVRAAGRFSQLAAYQARHAGRETARRSPARLTDQPALMFGR
jgi:hypothetical protein